MKCSGSKHCPRQTDMFDGNALSTRLIPVPHIHVKLPFPERPVLNQ